MKDIVKKCMENSNCERSFRCPVLELFLILFTSQSYPNLSLHANKVLLQLLFTAIKAVSRRDRRCNGQNA